jgi:hypothetical protein
MNIIDTLLILLIVVFIIDILLDNIFIKTLKTLFVICRFKLEEFKNSCYLPKYNYGNDRDELYKFLNNLIRPNINNYELTANSSQRILASVKFEKNIINYIDKIFNCSNFKFNNIKLLDNIYYYENPRGLDIEPFYFSSNIYINNKPLGITIFYIEAFLRDDLMDNNFFIKRIKIVKNKKVIQPNKVQVNRNNKSLAMKMSSEFNDYFVDRNEHNDLFIKSNNTTLNDSDNSLIPSIIDISPDSSSS